MIYFPMTVNILTPGHIQCLKQLTYKGKVYVGLLTSRALRGYKKELMSYKDRKYILEHLNIGNFYIVPQDDLDPSDNIKKYNCQYIASGDGFMPQEINAINKLKVKRMNIKLDGERKKRYSSTTVAKKCGII